MSRIITRLFVLCASLIVFSGAVVAASEAAPDAVAYSNLSRALQSDVVKKVTALPQWKEFSDALIAKIDSEYAKQQSQPTFPKEIGDMLLEKIRTGSGKTQISSRDAFELYFKYVQGAQINTWLSEDKPEPEGAIMIFTKFEPTELESFLKFVPGHIYSVLKKETDLTLYRFTHDNKEVYLGFTSVAGGVDSYVIVLSETQSRVEEQLKAAKTDAFEKTLYAKEGPFKKLELPEVFFEKARKIALQQLKDKSNGDVGTENMIKILENIESLQLTLGDESAGTRLNLIVTMKTEDEAKNLQEVAQGLLAMLRMVAMYNAELDENARKAIDLATKIQVKHEAQVASVSFNLSDEKLLELLAEVLPKLTEELRKN